MPTYPPNPVNCLGQIKDQNMDRIFAKRARSLFGGPSNKKPKLQKLVYFVLASDNLVKIGCTTNLQKRIGNLSVLHPTFKLLGTVDNRTEKQVHDIFSDFRVKGEWYRYDESMMDYIKIRSTN